MANAPWAKVGRNTGRQAHANQRVSEASHDDGPPLADVTYLTPGPEETISSAFLSVSCL